MGFSIMAPLIHACKKDATTTAATATDSSATGTVTTGSCVLTPTKEEGPFPYPTGEIKNPLDRVAVTGTQTGLPLTLHLTVVNTNASCAVTSGVRVDIWHCNKDGYYSGYASQPGVLGTQSYVGETWLRGYQTSDAKGAIRFTTIYPGWYDGRATHIHLEIFVNGTLKKIAQMAFPESISDAVHVTDAYKAHGINTTRNASDHVFGDSDLVNEMLTLAGDTTNGYTGTYTIGLAL